MKQVTGGSLKRLQIISVAILGLCVMLFFSACDSSYSGTGNSSTIANPTITGTVAGITSNSVTLMMQGKSVTIHGLSSSQVAMLQSQIGKIYTFHVTPNTDQSYNVTGDSNAVEPGDGTPEAQTANVGSIAFTGPVQSVSTNQVSVKLPDGQILPLATNAQTDMSDFNNAKPTNGQFIKVKAIPAAGGGFSATKLSIADSGDQQKANQMTFDGTTTSAVGSDNTIHMKIGNDSSFSSYSFTTSSSTEVKDFANVQAIGANQFVEVQAQFQGATPTVLEVKSGSSN